MTDEVATHQPQANSNRRLVTRAVISLILAMALLSIKMLLKGPGWERGLAQFAAFMASIFFFIRFLRHGQLLGNSTKHLLIVLATAIALAAAVGAWMAT